ncbi:MAG: hypothetical protein M1561_07045 [Gammaproteobacteria bacterium]|nr:hypothetical protein [Gammaproteobacteria bacterium]
MNMNSVNINNATENAEILLRQVLKIDRYFKLVSKYASFSDQAANWKATKNQLIELADPRFAKYFPTKKAQILSEIQKSGAKFENRVYKESLLELQQILEKYTDGEIISDIEKVTILQTRNEQNKISNVILNYKKPAEIPEPEDESLSLSHNQLLYTIGNNPDEFKQFAAYRTNKQFILVSTTSLRAILIACNLAARAQDGAFVNPPKIFFVDPNNSAWKFWQGVINLFKKYAQDEQTCLKNLTAFFRENYYLFLLPGEESVNKDFLQREQQGIKFFQNAFTAFGFNNVARIIINSQVFLQDWRSPTVFNKIYSYCAKNNFRTITYSANLIGLTHEIFGADESHKIFHSLECLNSDLEIHAKFTYAPIQTVDYIFRRRGECQISATCLLTLD